MQQCNNCKEIKSLEDFRYRNKEKEIRQKMCKDCMKIRDKKYYKTNEIRRESISKRSREQLDMKSKFFDDYRSNIKCLKCGESKIYMIDMHHVDKDLKIDSVSMMIKKGYSLDNIKKELEKCVPLCANHHREFHYIEELNGISLEDYLKNV